MKVIVDASNRSIEDPDVIEKILKHLGLDAETGLHNRSPPTDTSGLFNQVTNLI